MTEKIKVRHDGEWGDWLTFCAEHHDSTITPSWESAYVAALGHVCMYHGSDR